MIGADLDIRDAGFALIGDIPDRPPTAWPNQRPDDVRPDTGLWLEVKWFPNEPGDIFWGNSAPVRRIGFFQIKVCARIGAGLDLEDEAQRIIDSIQKGAELASVRVRKKPFMAPIVEEDDHIYVPVTVPYLGVS